MQGLRDWLATVEPRNANDDPLDATIKPVLFLRLMPRIRRAMSGSLLTSFRAGLRLLG